MNPAWENPFITPPDGMSHPALYRDFSVCSVLSARLDITGLGLYRAFINGQRVGGDYLSPGFNDYDAYLRYQSYDVTELLAEQNRIEVILGDGWYKSRYGLNSRENIFGSRYLLSARLTVRHPDGTETVLITDESWLAVRSCIVSSSIYDGEVRDDTLASDVPAACRVAETGYRPEPQFSPPIRVIEELEPTLIVTPAGENVLDFGQNMAGVVRFVSRLPQGAELRLQYGEILQGGCFYRGNLRSARAEFRYVSDGAEKPVEPMFTYYGFRYVKVESPEKVDPADFTALALSSDLRETLSVDTDSEELNRLMQNAVWGRRSNFLDVPTDCPQRDERLGWTADTQVFVTTACYQADCKDFYRKYMRDLRADQTLYYAGDLPMYCPSLKHECGPGGAIWADAATIIPWNVYRFYGDKELLSENYPMMRDYAEAHIAADAAHGNRRLVDYGFCFGDWLALDGASPLSMKGGTEDAYIQSVSFFYSLRLVSQAAEALEKKDDAARYAAFADEVHRAILNEYFTPAGRLSIDTQTAYVLSLAYGVWRTRERVVEGLRTRLQRDGWQLRTGFAGTPLLLPVLFDSGMADAAWRMLCRREFPGWLYAVDLGATTVWERWNSVQPDGSISDTGMNSLNHYAYGSVCEAIYSRIAGLACGEPGWRTARIAPQPNGRLKRVEMTFDSPVGRWRVMWRIHEDGRLSLEAEVPAGAGAELVLPDHPDRETRTLGAGLHRFFYQPTADYLHPLSVDAPLCDLKECAEAMEVIKQASPGLCGFVAQSDAAFEGESIRALTKTMPFLADVDLERINVALRCVEI